MEETPCKTRDLSTPAETFKALADEYQFDHKIAEALVTAGCKTLHDFRYLVVKEEQLQTVCT